MSQIRRQRGRPELRLDRPAAARGHRARWTIPPGGRALRARRGPAPRRRRALAAGRPGRSPGRPGRGARWRAGGLPRSGRARAHRGVRLGHASCGAGRPGTRVAGGAGPRRAAGAAPRAGRGGPALPAPSRPGSRRGRPARGSGPAEAGGRRPAAPHHPNRHRRGGEGPGGGAGPRAPGRLHPAPARGTARCARRARGPAPRPAPPGQVGLHPGRQERCPARLGGPAGSARSLGGRGRDLGLRGSAGRPGGDAGGAPVGGPLPDAAASRVARAARVRGADG